MQDPALGALWLTTHAVDILKANARHGITPCSDWPNFPKEF